MAEDIQSAIHNLESHIHAFLLLDLDLDGADLFLDAIVTNFYDPPPYLLVANHFSDGFERASILDRGADVCLKKAYQYRRSIGRDQCSLTQGDSSTKQGYKADALHYAYGSID